MLFCKDYSRRDLFRAAAGALALLPFRGTLSAAIPALAKAEPGKIFRREYRADAVILLFSLPVYTREGVGSGFATAKRENAGGQMIESLQFGAGSDPERARGLNRLGFIEEKLTLRNGSPAESIYTGFMTASEEQSFDQARKALDASSGMLPYMGIEGRIQPGEARSRSVRFQTPAAWNWTRFDELMPMAEQILRSAAKDGPNILQSRETIVEGVAAQGPRSFLSAVMAAIHDGAEKNEYLFVYGGGQHRLQSEKRPDAKMGKRLVSRGLAKNPEAVMALHGKLQQVGGSANTKFRVWFDKNPANPLPLRIEFQPKSFLALAFEAKQG